MFGASAAYVEGCTGFCCDGGSRLCDAVTDSSQDKRPLALWMVREVFVVISLMMQAEEVCRWKILFGSRYCCQRVSLWAS